ncbi:MAG: PHP domain-containing protein [Phycisphaerae bacterium]|nr:PHP domain-containing protein [Phycisphaerae bacterium]
MINYDLHIHTEYCGHAPGMSIEAIIAAAEEKQLETIAITEHIFNEDDLRLLTKINDQVSQIKTDVKVIVGAEVDADGARCDGKLITDKLDNIPYVLGSIHYIPGTVIYPSSPLDNPLGPDEFFHVWQSTLIGLVSNPRIDTLAHPGRLAGQSCDLDIFFDDMLAVFSQAAQLSAMNNICWEVNELNERKVPAEYHRRWNEIYKTAIDAGVKLVYGSDAHRPGEIGKHRFSQQMISGLGKFKLETPQTLGLI